MNKISKDEVRHIANLARINITESEEKKYSKELSSVLGYVEKLKKVDTKNVKETSQVTGLENVYRKDKVRDDWKADEEVKKNRAEMLKNAKEKKGDYISVKKILD